MRDGTNTVNRRRFIQSAGILAASAGIAGCSGGGGDDGGDSSDGSSGGDSGGSGDGSSESGGSTDTASSADVEYETEVSFSLYPVIAHGLPLTVGQERGFFEDNGVRITSVVSGGGGADSIRPVTTGDIGFGMASPNAATKAFLAGAPLRWGALATATPEVDFQTKPDRPFDKIQDLNMDDRKGKIAVTGTGSSTEANAYLSVTKASGITLDDVEFVYAGGLGEARAAMENGVADVTMNTNPFSTRQLEAGDTKRVWHTREFAPNFTEDILAFGDIMFDQKLDLAKRLMRGWIDSIEFIHDNVEMSGRMWAQAADYEESIAIKALKDTNPEDFYRVTVREGFVQNTEEVMKFQGGLGQDQSLAPDALIIQAALPEDRQADWLDS